MTSKTQGMMSYNPTSGFLTILYLHKFPEQMDSEIKKLGFTEYKSTKEKMCLLSYTYSGAKEKAKTLVPKIKGIAKENNLELISESARKAYANFGKEISKMFA